MNYELLIMMHLDNCCENQGGVARQKLFVFNNVPSFAATVRKLVYSLWGCLRHCDNVLWVVRGLQGAPIKSLTLQYLADNSSTV